GRDQAAVARERQRSNAELAVRNRQLDSVAPALDLDARGRTADRNPVPVGRDGRERRISPPERTARQRYWSAVGRGAAVTRFAGRSVGGTGGIAIGRARRGVRAGAWGPVARFIAIGGIEARGAGCVGAVVWLSCLFRPATA